MYSFVNDLLEDGLQRSKHEEATSQNNKWVFMVTSAISWIKYYIDKVRLHLVNSCDNCD
jgi:hypothetical protein